MKRILVAGGAGFIGSHLCKRLTDDAGNRVVCLDNLITGKRENIAGLESRANFSFVAHDIEDRLPESVSHFDEIYNLACPASPPHYQRDPIKTTRTSVLGVMNLLDAAKSCGAKILQASTSEVYGDPSAHPQTEDYWGNVNPVGVRSCYDEGKRCAETLMMDYARQYGVAVKIVRIFNTYGPGMSPDDGRVISNFVVQALRGEPITVYGDGSQTRSFQYVSDLVSGMVAMMATDDTFSGPVNLGNPGEFTIRELADRVITLTGSKSDVVTMPLPADDQKQRKPSIDLAMSKLGWVPTVSLDDGLIKTIEYFKTII